MKVNINIKGVSNRKNKILQIEYIYPDMEFKLRDFLAETVKISVKNYNNGMETDEVLKNLSAMEIADQAVQGKVSFGIRYDKRKANEKEAVLNAIQCFKDGMIAVFVDGERYEDLDENIPVKEGSEITFVRLTFLAGRMW